MKEDFLQIDCQALGIPDIDRLCFVKYAKVHMPLELHTHPDRFEICYHIAGIQTYIIDGKEYHTKGGSLFISLPDEVHSTGVFYEEKSTFYYMIFCLKNNAACFLGFNQEETAYLKNCLYGVRNRQVPANARIKAIFHDINREYRLQTPLMKVKIHNLLNEFFCELIDCFADEAKTMQSDIRKAIDYLDQNPQANHSVNELARISCLSVPRFKQKFKDITGIPPIEYATRNKIEQAKQMLQGNEISITAVAYDLGFSSGQHFSSIFKKYTTYSPGKYRRWFKDGKLKM